MVIPCGKLLVPILTNHWRGEYEISFLLYLVQIFHGTKVSSDFWISAMEEIFLVSSIKYELHTMKCAIS